MVPFLERMLALQATRYVRLPFESAAGDAGAGTDRRVFVHVVTAALQTEVFRGRLINKPFAI